MLTTTRDLLTTNCAVAVQSKPHNLQKNKLMSFFYEKPFVSLGL